jgi:hypothetical protein
MRWRIKYRRRKVGDNQIGDLGMEQIIKGKWPPFKFLMLIL